MYDRPWHALHRALARELPPRWPRKPSRAPGADVHTAMTSWLARALGEAPKMGQRGP